MDKNLFFYELEGRGYIFQNKKWDEAKHGFEDDMLNMAWEMWSSAKHSVKAQAVPEGFVLVPKINSEDGIDSMALRYRHDFPLLDETYRNGIRSQMRQLYEEAIGLGFYTHQKY
jgi:hypothetical protein